MFTVTRITFLAYACLLLVIVAALLMPHLVVKHDSLAHIAAYSLLMVWPAIMIRDLKKTAIAAIMIVTMSGVVEYLQRYSPERTASWSDFGMNTVGVMVGLIAGLLLKKKLRPAQA